MDVSILREQFGPLIMVRRHDSSIWETIKIEEYAEAEEKAGSTSAFAETRSIDRQQGKPKPKRVGSNF